MRLIILLVARKLGVSIFAALIIILCMITVLFGVFNPDGWAFFDTVGILIWLGLCCFVVVVNVAGAWLAGDAELLFRKPSDGD